MESLNDDRKINVYLTQECNNNLYSLICTKDSDNCIYVFGISGVKRMMYNILKECKTRKLRDNIKIFIDLRCIKGKLDDYYILCDNLKSGYLWSMKGRYEEYDIEPPKIYVFSNLLPKLNLLTHDKWDIKRIDENL